MLRQRKRSSIEFWLNIQLLAVRQAEQKITLSLLATAFLTSLSTFCYNYSKI